MIAAISVGVYKGDTISDLEYLEDSDAETDMNVIMTETGKLIEVQGTAEGEPFTHAELMKLLESASQGISEIVKAQKVALES